MPGTEWGGGGVIKMVSAPDDGTHQDDNSINIFSSCFTVTVKGLRNCCYDRMCGYLNKLEHSFLFPKKMLFSSPASHEHGCFWPGSVRKNRISESSCWRQIVGQSCRERNNSGTEVCWRTSTVVRPSVFCLRLFLTGVTEVTERQAGVADTGTYSSDSSQSHPLLESDPSDSDTMS